MQRSRCFCGAYAQTHLQVVTFHSSSQGELVCSSKVSPGVRFIDSGTHLQPSHLLIFFCSACCVHGMQRAPQRYGEKCA